MIDKKNARILFNVNNEAKITELVVVEFTEEENPQELYQTYSRDLGNCNINWEKYDPIYIFLQLWGVYNGFINKGTEDKALKELMKIKEFNDPIKKFFQGPNAYDEED